MSQFFSILLSLFSFALSPQASSSPIVLNQNPYSANIRTFDFLNQKDPNAWPQRNWEFPFIEINAASAIAMSPDATKIYYQKNILNRLPMASITKLMTAVLVLENYNLDDVITISRKAVSREGERGDLRPGEKITVRSLLSMMLIQSSNDAAVALAEYWLGTKDGSKKETFKPFVAAMNKKAHDLGLENTHFENPDGIDEKEHFSSALDVAKLLSYFASHFPWALEILRTQKVSVFSQDGRIEHKLVSSDELLKDNPSILGGKTGFTEKASGCLALLISGFDDKNVITVVLGSSDRFGESSKLIEWLKKAYRWQ